MSKEKPDSFKPIAVPEPKPSEGNPAPMPTVPTTETMTRLAAFVENEFRINRDHRSSSGIDKALAYAGRASRMKYSPRQEQILRDNHIDPCLYPPITPTKIRTAKAMLADIIKSSGDKPYVLSPTPRPTLPKYLNDQINGKITQEITDFMSQHGAFTNEDEFAVFQIAISAHVGRMYNDMRNLQDEIARERCDRMDEKIHDQFVEGDFMTAFNKTIDYLVTYGTGIMIGPIPRVVAQCKCKDVEGIDGAVKYTREYVTIPTYEAVSPWDCYPAPNAKEIGEGSLCIKVRYAANVLWQYAEAADEDEEGHRGWQRKTVRALLSRYPKGGLKLAMETHDVVRRDIERDSMPSADDCTLEGIRCFASVRGSELITCGVLKTPDDKPIVHHQYYKTETIVMGGYVVYCRIIDDRMVMPIAKATMYETPDSWWGTSIAEYCAVPQSMQNNAFKNLTVNGALTSNGMFVCTDVNNAVSLDGSPALALRAGKVFGFKRHAVGGASQGAPLSVLTVPDTAATQLKLMHEAMVLADDYTGIVQSTVGSTSTLGAGASRTASGMAMISEASCRVINECIIRLSNSIIVPMVKNTHVYNLLNDDDMSIKGDVEVAPAGLMGKILREAESQRRQQVAAALAQHPILAGAIPLEGHFELFRPELENIGVNPDKIIPSKERLELYQLLSDVIQAQKAAQQPQQGGMDGGMAGASPTPEQANVARVEGDPQSVALQQGTAAPEPRPGSVRERRNAA